MFKFLFNLGSNKKRRVNSNTQNEIQKNISDPNIEINKKAIISPRNLPHDHSNIFDKITEIKLDKNKAGGQNQNFKNARNTVLINNPMKNFDASDIVYTHNNYSDTPYRIILSHYREGK
jgi:hypothetical protein